jgi:hypothetical protein
LFRVEFDLWINDVLNAPQVDLFLHSFIVLGFPFLHGVDYEVLMPSIKLIKAQLIYPLGLYLRGIDRCSVEIINENVNAQ